MAEPTRLEEKNLDTLRKCRGKFIVVYVPPTVVELKISARSKYTDKTILGPGGVYVGRYEKTLLSEAGDEIAGKRIARNCYTLVLKDMFCICSDYPAFRYYSKDEGKIEDFDIGHLQIAEEWNPAWKDMPCPTIFYPFSLKAFLACIKFFEQDCTKVMEKAKKK